MMEFRSRIIPVLNFSPVNHIFVLISLASELELSNCFFSVVYGYFPSLR